jgi:hypothetical protein
MFRLFFSTFLALVAVPALASTADFDDKRVEVVGPQGEMHSLVRASASVVVEVPPEQAWALLADFGSVQDYFASIVKSDWIGDPGLAEGSERFCDLSFQGRDVHVKERIFELEPGSHFVYDVYDWENFPLKRMHNTFGVRVDAQGRTVVYNVIDFKLKPAMMSGLMRKTMAGSARATMLGMKHVLETGDGTLSREALEALYPDA